MTDDGPADERIRQRTREIVDEALAGRRGLQATIDRKTLEALERASGDPEAAHRVLVEQLLTKTERREYDEILRRAITQAYNEVRPPDLSPDPFRARIFEGARVLRWETWGRIRGAPRLQWLSLYLCRRWHRHLWDSWIEVDLVGDPHNVGEICLYCGETRRRPE